MHLRARMDLKLPVPVPFGTRPNLPNPTQEMTVPAELPLNAAIGT